MHSLEDMDWITEQREEAKGGMSIQREREKIPP